MCFKAFRLWAAPLLLAVVLIGGSPVRAVDFSGDLVIGTHKMKDTLKIFVKDHNYRHEDMDGDKKTVVIRKAGQTWILEPDEDHYRKLDPAEIEFLDPVAAWENSTRGMEGRHGGIEKINGYNCDKFIYNRKGESSVILERWLAIDLYFIIKQEHQDECGMGRMELLNINIGPLDDSLLDYSTQYSGPKSSEDQKTPASLNTTERVSAPVSRKVSTGGELRVEVDPSCPARVKLENLISEESRCTVTPLNDGRQVTESGVSCAVSFALTKDGQREETTFGSHLRVDELVIWVDGGLIEASVESETSECD